MCAIKICVKTTLFFGPVEKLQVARANEEMSSPEHQSAKKYFYLVSK